MDNHHSIITTVFSVFSFIEICLTLSRTKDFKVKKLLVLKPTILANCIIFNSKIL